jgi:hypothetical protein
MSQQYTCRVCEKEFASRKELGRHVRSEHLEYFRERNKLFTVLMVPFTLGIALGIMGDHFINTDTSLANTLLILLLVDTAVAFYIIYRGYRLPEKYKRHTILV